MRDRLVEVVGESAVSERPVRDLWPLGLVDERAGRRLAPVPVVRPGDYRQVAALLRWAAEAGVAVVPFGGASGVCGAVEVSPGQVALDLTGLDRVLEVDELNLTCRVQAGVLGGALEAELNSRRLTLGHLPGSLPISTVGGLISTRSSGQQSTRYGSIEDMLLGVTAMLADGTLLEPRPGPRSAAGPALHQLLAGAEGGLAVILEAVLRVSPQPELEIGWGRAFPRLEDGLEAMRQALQAGLRPLVLRLYDPEDSLLQGADLDGGCLMVAAVAGRRRLAEAEADLLAQLCAAGADLGADPWERWKRHRFDLSAERMRELLGAAGSFLDTIEVAAPWDRLPGLHRDLKAVLAKTGLALCHFSHAQPQGCCAYFTFGGSAGSEGEAREAYLEAWRGAMAACRRYGGTITHHHGVGQARRAWVREELGGWWQVWEVVRGALDPLGTLNPRALGGMP